MFFDVFSSFGHRGLPFGGLNRPLVYCSLGVKISKISNFWQFLGQNRPKYHLIHQKRQITIIDALSFDIHGYRIFSERFMPKNCQFFVLCEKSGIFGYGDLGLPLF